MADFYFNPSESLLLEEPLSVPRRAFHVVEQKLTLADAKRQFKEICESSFDDFDEGARRKHVKAHSKAFGLKPKEKMNLLRDEGVCLEELDASHYNKEDLASHAIEIAQLLSVKDQKLFLRTVGVDPRLLKTGSTSSKGKTRAKESHSTNFRQPFKPDFARKEAKVWRPPVFDCSRVPKPTAYSREAFKRWVHGETFHLSKQITSTNFYVTGSKACEDLYFGRPGHSARLKNAFLFIEGYKTSFKAPQVTGHDCYDVVHVRGTPVSLKDVVALWRNPEVRAKVSRKLGPEFWEKFGNHVAQQSSDFSRPFRHQQGIIQRKLDFVFGRETYAPVPEKEPVKFVDTKPVNGPAPQPKYLEAVKCDLGRLVYEGGAVSRAVDERSADIISNSVAIIYNRYERPGAQLLTFLAALYLCENWKQRLAAFSQFVTSNDALWHRSKSFLNTIPSFLVYEGAGDGEEKVDGWVDKCVHFIVSNTAYVFLEECATTVFNAVSGPIMSYLKTLRFSLEKLSSVKIAEFIIQAIQECVTRFKNCVDAKSLAPLWGVAWDPVRWAKHARGLISHYSVVCCPSVPSEKDLEVLKRLRETEDIPLSWTEPVNPGQYLERLSDVIAQGRTLRTYFAKSPIIVQELTSCIRSCESFLELKTVSSYCSKERICPFFLVMYGPPGTGKTVLESKIRSAVAACNSYDSSPQGTYSWVPNANFQTNLSSDNWAIKMDDPDHGVAPPAAGVPTHIDSICKLVNNASYAVEEASVELKGKTFANPLLVTYLTNFENCRVTENLSKPEAFWRRIDMHVTVKVKEAFSSGSGKLDPALAAKSDSHDMFIMCVRFYDKDLWSDSNSNCIPLTKAVEYSFPDFMVLLLQRFADKLRVQRDLLASQSANGPVCRFCFLPSSKDCGHERDDNLIYEGGPLEGEDEEGGEIPPLGFRCWRVGKKLLKNGLDVVARETKFDWNFSIARLTNELKNVSSNPVNLAALAGVVTVAGIALFSAKRVLQGREGNSTGAVPANWFRAAQNFTPSIPLPHTVTYTYDDLLKSISDAMISVKGPAYSVYGHCVGQNMFLVPTHAMYVKNSKKVTYPVELIIAHSGVATQVVLTEFDVCIFGAHPEVSLIKLSNIGGRGSVAAKIWPIVDESVQMFDELKVCLPRDIISAKKHWFEASNSNGSVCRNLAANFESPTDFGDCGCFYIGRFGSAWKIVAMHFARNEGILLLREAYSVGAVFSGADVKIGCAQLSSFYQGLETPSQLLTKGLNFQMVNYPEKSEIWTAKTHHDAKFFPLGMIVPPISGNTYKTRVTRSIIEPFFKDWIDEWCGREDYWRLPEFRGRMEGEPPVWNSPYVKAFSSDNDKDPDSYFMWLALADYINGMKDLDCAGYAVLSEEQSMKGVPNSIIGAFNLKTSVGPPYNGAKSKYVCFDGTDCWMDDALWQSYDALERVVESGSVPCPVGLCTLKDEGLKPGKMPRVFTCLPFVFNMLAKRYFAAIISFMRANFTFFESAVGINMTSSDAGRIVMHLARVDPSLTRILEKDAVQMDKSLNGKLYDFSGLVVYAICIALGLPAAKAVSIFSGVKHCRYSIKNDLFSKFWNPSGWYGTVETNGWDVSLGERYVYYRTTKHPLPSRDEVLRYSQSFLQDPFDIPFSSLLVFRKEVALVHYGDDNLCAMRCEVSPNYEAIWKDEVGIVMTDAAKTGKVTLKTIFDVEFLKRRFAYHDDLGVWMTPLSKKSMARTLALKKDSVLSKPDHACVAMSEVMREAVYHGPEFYTMVRERCDRCVQSLNLAGNSYYVSRPYEYWYDKIKEGGFAAWVPLERPELQTVSYDF